MDRLKIVVVDDKAERRAEIQKCIPDYAICILENYGARAMDAIRPDDTGCPCDMVIMNADDPKGLGLYMFDWLKNKEPENKLYNIPVILVTEDEFSDRCMEFLEIGDAVFYEGEIDEDRLYSTIMQTFDSIDFKEEPWPEEAAYSEDKSFERVLGMKLKAHNPEDAMPRTAVLDMDTRLENLEAALERGRSRAQAIRNLFDGALEYKNNKSAYAKSKGSFLNFTGKVREDKGLPTIEEAHSRANISNEVKKPEKVKTVTEEIPKVKKEFHPNQSRKPIADNVVSREYSGGNRYGECPSVTANVAKKTIVIVDDDEKIIKTCELFLGGLYNIIGFTSGMKAIDYFVRNKADMILMDTVMPYLDGMQTASSIGWQPNGKNVPIVYLVGNDFLGDVSLLAGSNVRGVMRKPLSQRGLLAAVDSVLKRGVQF